MASIIALRGAGGLVSAARPARVEGTLVGQIAPQLLILLAKRHALASARFRTGTG
jgi:hypothetical protein